MAQKPEEPAQNWQITSIEKRLEIYDKFQSKVDSKLDAILINQITAKQFEERINAITKSYDDKLEDAVEKVHLKYGPLSDNVKWLVRAIIGGVIGIIVQTFIIIINIYGKR